jgi:hypothetical protein
MEGRTLGLWLRGGLSALAAIALAGLAASAQAQVDGDGDGFLDAEELVGLRTADGASFDYPSCIAEPSTAPDCLDPGVPDVFIETVLDAFSVCPTNTDPRTGQPVLPLGCKTSDFIDLATEDLYVLYSNPLSGGANAGLGIRVHQPPSLGSDRVVTPRQKALTMTENASATFTELVNDGTGSFVPSLNCPLEAGLLGGFMTAGSPNGPDDGQVRIRQAVEWVECVYRQAANSDAGAKETDTRNLILWLYSHEAGHGSGPLYPQYSSRHNGYHIRAGSGVAMQNGVSATIRKSGAVQFDIPFDFSSTSQEAVDLAGP